MRQQQTSPVQTGFGSLGFFIDAQEAPIQVTRPDREVRVHIAQPDNTPSKNRKRREKTNKGRARGRRQAINQGVQRGRAGWQSPLELKQNTRERALRKLDASVIPGCLPHEAISEATVAVVAHRMLEHLVFDLRSDDDARIMEAIRWLLCTDAQLPFRTACFMAGIDARLFLLGLAPNLNAMASAKVLRLCADLGIGFHAKTVGDILEQI